MGFFGFFFFFFLFKYFVCCLLFFLLFLVPLKFMEITVTVSRPCLKLVGISKPKLPQPGSEALMFSKASFTFLAAESGRWYLHCNVYWKYLLQWHQTFTRTYDEPTSPSYRPFLHQSILQSGLRQCNMAIIIQLSLADFYQFRADIRQTLPLSISSLYLPHWV